MKKYMIAIEETVVDEFEVIAKNEEKAIEIARNKYNEGEFILESGEVHHKHMAVVKPYREKTDWIEI